MKTSELTGAALDWAVTRCDRPEIDLDYFLAMHNHYNYPVEAFDYSTNWAQGGEIIERERIGVWWDGVWHGKYDGCHPDQVQDAGTPLIAAMRCYVASKLGDEIEIPETLK